MLRNRTSFLGRQDEVTALAAVFAQGARLVTVLGPPGMGKTRFARQFAAHAASMPVHVCDFAPAQGVSEVLDALVGVLQLPRERTRSPTEDVARIAERLAARGPRLLLLDNFEHVVDVAAAALDELIDAAPEARFLVTSRLRLRLEGEVTFDLPPLPRSPAVELFVQRAALARPGYALADHDRPVVEELVEQLDRMPRAIELAASRARLLTPRQLLDRLGRRLDLLQSRSRDADARHSSMRHAIERSWEMLTTWEKEALAQSSIFRGAFDVDAAEGILDLGPEAPPVLDVLDALVEHSMLHVVPGSAHEPTSRLAMYASIRAYAAEKLAAGEGEAALRTRHARWYTRRHAALRRQAGLVFDVSMEPATSTAAQLHLDVGEEPELAALADKEPAAPQTAHPTRSGHTLRLPADGGWFELELARVDLNRRATLKRILLALATRHRERPGVPLLVDEVLAAGWPGEKILPEAGRQRVYTALSSLRDMGLRDVLLRRPDGYLLDPDLSVAWTPRGPRKPGRYGDAGAAIADPPRRSASARAPKKSGRPR